MAHLASLPEYALVHRGDVRLPRRDGIIGVISGLARQVIISVLWIRFNLTGRKSILPLAVICISTSVHTCEVMGAHCSAIRTPDTTLGQVTLSDAGRKVEGDGPRTAAIDAANQSDADRG